MLPLTAMDLLLARSETATGRSVPSDALMGLVRATSRRTHLFAPATMVRPALSRTTLTPITLMTALLGRLGNSANLLTLTQHSEEDKQQRERREDTKMYSLDHGCLRQGEFGRKVNGCWLYILVLCDLLVRFHDSILRRVSPARVDADRVHHTAHHTNKADILLIAYRAVLPGELPLCAPCYG